MKKRTFPPFTVLFTALLFIATGVASIGSHAGDYFEANSINEQSPWVLCVRLLAIVCGILLLKGLPSGRWLAIVWLAYHAIIGFFHSAEQTIIHIVLLLVITFLLFMPRSSGYFKGNG